MPSGRKIGSKNCKDALESNQALKANRKRLSDKRKHDRHIKAYKTAQLELIGYADLCQGNQKDAYNLRIINENSANKKQRIENVLKAAQRLRLRRDPNILQLTLPHRTYNVKPGRYVERALQGLDEQMQRYKEHGFLGRVEHIKEYRQLLANTQGVEVKELSLLDVLLLDKTPQYGVAQIGVFTKKQFEWYIKDPRRIRSDLPIKYKDDSTKEKSFDKAVLHIKTGKQLDVQMHDTDGPPLVQTKSVDDVLDFLNKAREDRTPVNILDMEPIEIESFPMESLPCLKGLQHREPLDDTNIFTPTSMTAVGSRKKDGPKGKKAARQVIGKPSSIRINDLSACERFALLAIMGAFSRPHMDRAHVFTSVCCRDGSKLWPMFAALTKQQKLEFGRTGDVPTDVPSFTVVLERRDVLVMPPCTVHFPYTLTDCYMEGAMHMMMSDFLSIAKTSFAELAFPHITNEPTPQQLYGKLQHFYDKCKASPNDPLYGRPSKKEDLNAFKLLIKKLKPLQQLDIQSCRSSCAAEGKYCVAGSCTCMKAKRKCNKLCHRESIEDFEECTNRHKKPQAGLEQLSESDIFPEDEQETGWNGIVFDE